MQWDLGVQGMAYLGAMSLGFGLLAGLVVGHGVLRRVWALAITMFACFSVGLVTSELMFGWATENELQPNIDGLSRDEVLLSSVLTTAVVVLVLRLLARPPRDATPAEAKKVSARHHGRHAGHA
jgi:hypothetical protein